MARRTKNWVPVGKWLRTARKRAGLSLQLLAKRTGVSLSALARFESDRAVPSFGDVCAIAQELGWPLLYFATGLERTGDDVRAVAAQLRYWGLRDVRLAEPVLFGELRPFEELLPEVGAAGAVNLRLLDALPALLLCNRFDSGELISHAESRGSLRRVGWIADVASRISELLPRSYSLPETRRRLRDVITAADRQLETNAEIDYLGSVRRASSPKDRERLWKTTPPLTRRWRIACDISLEQFVERAKSVLEGV